MAKAFNVTGACIPEEHYMVKLDERLREIRELVDAGKYFSVNRARQYGKTTVLMALERYLQNVYRVVLLDFQTFDAEKFRSGSAFAAAFAKSFLRALRRDKEEGGQAFQAALSRLQECAQGGRGEFALMELFEELSDICAAADRPIVLMIDEVDSASNNQVFLDFLSQMRGYYIDRDEIPFFRSVILSGVYDVKNLKRKFVTEDSHKTNSPWNIAADFHVDLSFGTSDIAGMLESYEQNHHTGMDTQCIAQLIYDYTSGYPFLVSSICKLVDERIVRRTSADGTRAWTREDVLNAVRILLSEQNTLFESLINKLEDYPELESTLRDLLFLGKEIPYVVGLRSIEMALMFGFVKKERHTIVIANRIFETLLYNLFLASPSMQQNVLYNETLRDKNQFTLYRIKNP